jgi:hypothetical protein
MKRYLLPLLAVLMAVLACGPLDTAGEIVAGLFRVYYVAPDGDDAYDCRSHTFPTIFRNRVARFRAKMIRYVIQSNTSNRTCI